MGTDPLCWLKHFRVGTAWAIDYTLPYEAQSKGGGEMVWDGRLW